jgi:hypothetical protein
MTRAGHFGNRKGLRRDRHACSPPHKQTVLLTCVMGTAVYSCCHDNHHHFSLTWNKQRRTSVRRLIDLIKVNCKSLLWVNASCCVYDDKISITRPPFAATFQRVFIITYHSLHVLTVNITFCFATIDEVFY